MLCNECNEYYIKPLSSVWRKFRAIIYEQHFGLEVPTSKSVIFSLRRPHKVVERGTKLHPLLLPWFSNSLHPISEPIHKPGSSGSLSPSPRGSQTAICLRQVGGPWVLCLGGGMSEVGYKHQFWHWSPLTRTPMRPSEGGSKTHVIQAEIEALLRKQAIEEESCLDSPGFYSMAFVVPKPEGKWRLVISLKALNQFL